ncbi:MAG: signal peptide peptidase SppA [Proteobacteria bacterium]|nr:signal peptide peptidase SppA [Pseudomonadota bacterium]
MHTEKKRKKRRWLRYLIITAIVVVFYVGSGLFIKSLFTKTITVEPGTVLEISIQDVISEGPQDTLSTGLTGEAPLSIWDIRRALKSAATDPNIVGLLLMIQGFDFGWGVTEEILLEIDKFRESKKPIYVLHQSDLIEDIDYFLSTGGDQIWISPETGVLINGLAAEVTFWRGTLEKLRIEPEVIMFKEYKSAGESFLNREMSPYMREAMTKIINDIDARFKERIAKRRNVDSKTLNEFLTRGMSTTSELSNLGLIDRTGYLDELESAFEELPNVDEYKGVNHIDYLISLEQDSNDEEQTIAVVFGEGPILSQKPSGLFWEFGDFIYGPLLASHIREAADDETVKAIVMRVNSPGGSAVGSDVVRREIGRAREKGKPVIVSMSTVAGSGGYWISMQADSIVAQPTTLTGSIGVVFSKFNVTGFTDWIGLNVDTITTAPFADILGFAPLDAERRELVMIWMDDVYNSFVEKVAEGRNLTNEEVEEIARGRVWTGQDALKNGLIDRLGGMEDAISLAKERAGLDVEKDYPLTLFPKPKTFLQQILEGDILAKTPRIPTKTEIMKATEEIAKPEVLVKMPNVRIY